MQSIKKSEEGQEVTPTDERANGTERVLWNEKETGRAGAVALIKTVHGDAKEARCGTGSATESLHEIGLTQKTPYKALCVWFLSLRFYYLLIPTFLIQ